MNKQNMKQMKRTMTGVAFAALIALTGCNNADDEITPGNGLTPILLGTGMQTKAPVNTMEGLNTNGIGIFAITTKNTDAATAITDWTLAKVMNIERPTAIAAEGGGITLSMPYYYPTDASDYVKFMAFHPYAPKGTEGDNFLEVSDINAPQLNFTITGQEDIMYATPAIGNNATAVAQSLSFNHALTQITFKVIKDVKMTGDVKVKGIQFADVNTKSTMNIETGAVSPWATPGNLIAFTDATGLDIPASTETALVVGNPMMLEPGKASFNLTIATGAKTYSDIEVKPTTMGETAFEAGKSYAVTITFNVSETEPGKEITLSAAVEAWKDGGTGSGTVDE